jgi:hypothetical protein
MSGHTSHTSHTSSDAHAAHAHGAHEMSDATFNVAVWIIPGSMLIVAFFALVCYFYTASALTHEMTWKEAHGAEIDAQTLTAFEAKEGASMHRYQMNKTNKGMVQIPIEQAMALMVKDAGVKEAGSSTATSAKAK